MHPCTNCLYANTGKLGYSKAKGQAILICYQSNLLLPIGLKCNFKIKGMKLNFAVRVILG